MCLQDNEGFVFHYWALFDGHAGSGAAVVASRLLQHHIACQLQAVIEILRNMASLPPTILGEEPDNNPYLQGNTPGPHRSLTRAASLRGAMGTPSSPCSTPPPPRFFTEKKIQHESLVVGAIENAFKEMVSCRCKLSLSFSPLLFIVWDFYREKCSVRLHRIVLLFCTCIILASSPNFHTLKDTHLKIFQTAMTV